MEVASAAAEADSGGVPLFKKRNPKKSTIRKRPATPPSGNEGSSSGDEYSSADEDGRRIKRRRKAAVAGRGVITASSSLNQTKTGAGRGGGGGVPASSDKADELAPAAKYAADRSAHIASTNDATKQSNWFDEEAAAAAADPSLSAANLLGKTRPMPSSSSAKDRDGGGGAATQDGNYKGAAAYTSFITRSSNAPAPHKTAGPVKAPTNIRTITVTDYSPDVCKDYKQTGFCGFGDSCKFLHAREDYKQGWQLDKEWETVAAAKGKGGRGGTVVSSRSNKNNKASDVDSDDDDDDTALEGIPFACIICRGPYKNPIVTKCGHYFCESCALKRFRKSPQCAACGAGTGGVFNGAKNLKKLLDKKRERARRRKARAREAGEEVSSDDQEEDDDDKEEGGVGVGVGEA